MFVSLMYKLCIILSSEPNFDVNELLRNNWINTLVGSPNKTSHLSPNLQQQYIVLFRDFFRVPLLRTISLYISIYIKRESWCVTCPGRLLGYLWADWDETLVDGWVGHEYCCHQVAPWSPKRGRCWSVKGAFFRCLWADLADTLLEGQGRS